MQVENRDLYKTLLTNSTKLGSRQVTTLVDLISGYDESAELLYEVIGLLNNGNSFTKVKNDITKEKFEWEGSAYDDLAAERRHNDSILEKPPEIREGENECPKCHQKKTLVVEMQTRSADEGYTYYIHCFNPKCRAITK